MSSHFTLLVSLRKSRRSLAQTERRLKAILDNVSESVIETDGEGRIIAWNRTAERMFRWTRLEVLGRKLPEVVLAPPYRGFFEGKIRHLGIDPESASGGIWTVTALRQNRAPFAALASLAVMRSEDGPHFFAFFRESEHVEAYSGLNAA